MHVCIRELGRRQTWQGFLSDLTQQRGSHTLTPLVSDRSVVRLFTAVTDRSAL